MNRIPHFLAPLLILAAAPVLAQGGDSAPADTLVPIDGVVAVVGDQPILRTQVEEQIGALAASGQQMPTDSAGRAALAQQVLGTIIDEELLIHEAKAQKIEVSESEISGQVDQQLTKIRGRFSNDTEFRDQLKSAGFGTPDEYRRWLLDQARRQALQQQLFQKLRQDQKLTPAPVSEAEVDSFFQASKDQMKRLPATVTYRQIVITPKPSAQADSMAFMKAESLLVEIRKGADFAQVAKRESMDPGSKEQGGDLGWHRRGEFVPTFDRVYFALRPGQVSPVIKTTFGYHIIKIDRVQPSEVKGRHILIRPEIDSAQVAKAHALADSVAALWRAGANYDSLAAKYHDPSEEKMMPEPFPQEQLPQEYQAAIKGHKAGDILDPFSIMDKTRGVPKFFVLQLTSVEDAREPTVADFRQQIRDQLSQQKAIRRYLDGLRKQIFVSVRS
ncbi:MAG TPA: peptidylprolyl isomerase [Gemmatimonadaceae bacterium]|nr:peptidylprolyl isomerase [Gemmatimonadaceae bacterium]